MASVILISLDYENSRISRFSLASSSLETVVSYFRIDMVPNRSVASNEPLVILVMSFLLIHIVALAMMGRPIFETGKATRDCINFGYQQALD